MEKIENSVQSRSSGKIITMTYPEITKQFEKISSLYFEQYMHKEESIARFLSEEENNLELKNETDDDNFIVVYRSERFFRESHTNY